MFVYWFKCPAVSFQRGGSLQVCCRVRCRLEYSEVQTRLRVEMVLRAGAHNFCVCVNVRQHNPRQMR